MITVIQTEFNEIVVVGQACADETNMKTASLVLVKSAGSACLVRSIRASRPPSLNINMYECVPT
jgi:hypothetical protein